MEPFSTALLPNFLPLTAQQPAPPPTQPLPASPHVRSCVVCCTDAEADLVKACRICSADYCSDCLQVMFEAALKDQTRMPPRCCTFMQLYVSPEFARHSAPQYRAKLLEWLMRDKLYCPSARCSAFIPPNSIPDDFAVSVQEVCITIVQKMIDSECSLYFRGDVDTTKLPGYDLIIPNPIDLKDMRAKAESGYYSSLADLTKDITRLVHDAKYYYPSSDQEAKDADTLLVFFVQQLAQLLEDGQPTVGKSQVTIFSCPTCHIAICVKCKQIEHGVAGCDLSGKDHEMAVLESFGYKRCPNCGHGVRRMFGCSHMECRCGANWCWHCLQSIHDCPGDCGTTSDDEADHEDEDSEMANNEDVGPMRQDLSQRSASNAVAVPENLDGGGEPVWGDANMDFGEEPAGEPTVQVWACRHHWKDFEPPKDGLNHGDMSLVECNRCFAALPMSQSESRAAWECMWCHMIVCLDCRDGEVEE